MLKKWIPSNATGWILKSGLCLTLGIFLTVFVTTASLAQSRTTITGTVTDAADGSGIPAVNVIIKGTLIGTATNIDGTYSLQVPSDAETLVFSSIGYITVEVQIDGRSTIDIQLQQDVQFLDDVVVVGYGSQQEKEITSSVTSVGEEDFNLGAVNDASSLIQGKVPGLSIYNRGGDPNSTPTIRLRGISTVGASTEPLVVIDGVIGGSLSNLDPSDIKSISVLKDGSAAAIYGTRGSSGVIIVTTKKGSDVAGASAGTAETLFEYSTFVAASSVLNTIENMSPGEFAAAGGNDLGAGTDWLDEVTRTALTNVHNLAISGGTFKTNYRASLNYRNVEGILEASGFEQLNGRFNLSHTTLNDKLRVDLNYSLTNRDSDYSFNDALRYAVLFNPTAPVYGADANIGDADFYSQFNGYFHPVGLFDSFNPRAMLDNNVNVGERKEVWFNTSANYKISDNWDVTATFSRQSADLLNKEYYSIYDPWRGGAATSSEGLARRFTNNTRSTLFEAYSTYKGTASKLDYSVTGGYSFQQDNYEDFLMEAGGFPNDDLLYNAFEAASDLGTAGQVVLQSGATPDEKIIAGFFRTNLTWDNTFFFNASLRREGATKFGEDNRWGLFPAVGIGTDLTSFFEIGPLDQLKVRLGYGVTGALPGSSGLSQFARTINGATQTSTILRAANPDLKWEQKAETNFGIDFGGEKFSGSIELYNRDVTDFILERVVSAEVYGFDRRFENAGDLNTKGLEISFNYDLISNMDMLYNTGLVFSTYNTTLEKYTTPEEMRANLGAPGQNGTNMIRVAEGEEIGIIWGPVYSGEVDENGVPVMVDLNGDGQILTNQTNALDDNGDFKALGNGIPDFEIGWTNQFSYKSWDVNAFFRGAFGHSLVNTYRAFYEPRIPSQGSYNLINTKYADDKVTSAQFSSLYVEEADFFKLDNLTIGYNMDTSKWDAISSLRVYASGQNLFVLTGYTGVDPEPALQDFGPTDNGGRAAASGDVLSPGIDRRYNYFSSRTFTLGVNIKF